MYGDHVGEPEKTATPSVKRTIAPTAAATHASRSRTIRRSAGLSWARFVMIEIAVIVAIVYTNVSNDHRAASATTTSDAQRSGRACCGRHAAHTARPTIR